MNVAVSIFFMLKIQSKKLKGRVGYNTIQEGFYVSHSNLHVYTNFVFRKYSYRKVSCITRTFFHPKFTQKWGVRIIHST